MKTLCPHEYSNKDKECQSCVDGSKFKFKNELQLHEKHFIDDNTIYNKQEQKVIENDIQKS